jgi:hypothetical protein
MTASNIIASSRAILCRLLTCAAGDQRKKRPDVRPSAYKVSACAPLSQELDLEISRWKSGGMKGGDTGGVLPHDL